MQFFNVLSTILAAIGLAMATPLPASELVARNVTTALDDYPATCNNEKLDTGKMWLAWAHIHDHIGHPCALPAGDGTAQFAHEGGVFVSGRRWGNVNQVDCGDVAQAVWDITAGCGSRGGSKGATAGPNTIVVHVASHWV
ncbi:hypothetical protein BT63DRAFT_480533 [Microthyrium microscopicum]|uniref:Ecp2 effector protein domain-containing protein n=1 Tax=Microthyrium microscopicum TaxID=703497 RepID=A0A6A6U906_9PEZI|nr:hypothetical protein BT63DRAFT_480533 [Microthyrium microscopicum]